MPALVVMPSRPILPPAPLVPTVAEAPLLDRLIFRPGSSFSRFWKRRPLSITVPLLDIHARAQRIVLDEFAPRIDHIAHQLGEKLVRLIGMLHLHQQEGAGILV